MRSPSAEAAAAHRALPVDEEALALGGGRRGAAPSGGGGARTFVGPDDVETQIFPWGSIKWTCTPDVASSQRFTLGVVVLHPGKGHARHNHPGVEEVLYVVDGEGEQMVEDAEGVPEVRVVRGGDTVHIPAGAFHATRNIGWRPMTIIAVYSPPGPEALLRSDPTCRLLAPGVLP